MIQRIQTVYFLVIAILSCFTFFVPVANLYDASNTFFYTLNYQGLKLVEGGETIILNNMNTWGLKIISALIPVLALVIIFMYKKRILQIRLSFINMILMLGYYAILFICIIQSGKQLDAEWSLNIPAAFPLVCVILNWLAIRAIGKDEALVKSLNRLR
ncbi:DUF4293 family protein [Paludibacter sp. 221]|uniref:DUF4293 domain-containing protein n=1 Tax=Paludibacter sp. 221 TaxID=2302939 RepID=UPI0013D52B16|nr:DUF4293 domain-containing protein [Paludibacter sp. 221]NDV45960.1 DUF4293 family protein [Paludibacter sp. 221]